MATFSGLLRRRCYTNLCKLINCKDLAKSIRDEVRRDVQIIKKQTGSPPGLGCILLGRPTESVMYINTKRKAAAEVGINFFFTQLPDTASEDAVISEIQAMNRNDNINAIILQLPLPEHLNSEKILQCIDIEKDVDGLHPLNIGSLAMKGRTPLFTPCTPQGCLEILQANNVSISGKHALVVGRSNIVGLPTALLMLNNNATVTLCHASSENLEEFCKQADIIISAVGQPDLIKQKWLKENAFVVDVGISRVFDKSAKRGYRVVGDVAKTANSKHTVTVTKVPGGVGPMTVAMLLKGTVNAAKARRGKSV